MKIVDTSNYDLDNYTEKVVAENICNEYYANGICELLNKSVKFGNSDAYYVVKPDDYKPFVWEP